MLNRLNSWPWGTMCCLVPASHPFPKWKFMVETHNVCPLCPLCQLLFHSCQLFLQVLSIVPSISINPSFHFYQSFLPFLAIVPSSGDPGSHPVSPINPPSPLTFLFLSSLSLFSSQVTNTAFNSAPLRCYLPALSALLAFPAFFFLFFF